MSQFNFFDTEKQLAKIHELNGFLPKLSQLIDFKIFRSLLGETRPNKEHNIERKVFDLFNELLAAQGGSIVDGTFVEVPRQRNTCEENARIKKGEVPESFQGDANKHKLAHKDLDACWAQKSDVNYFGYKDHVKTNVKYKLIRDYTVTDASVYHSLQNS